MGKLLDRKPEAASLPVQIPALWENEVTEGPLKGPFPLEAQVFLIHIRGRPSFFTLSFLC